MRTECCNWKGASYSSIKEAAAEELEEIERAFELFSKALEMSDQISRTLAVLRSRGVIAVEMPKMSDTMEEGVLVAWTVEEGEAVSAGDVIAELETEKATMDLEVYDNGVLKIRLIEEGETVEVGAIITVIRRL